MIADPRALLAPTRRTPSAACRLVLALTIAAAVVVSLTGHSFAAEKSKLKPYSVIIGTVWDKQGRAVPGVKIKIQRAGDKHPKWELFSDRNGEFAQRFPAGTADYLIWAEIKAKKGHIAETKVHIENDERQDVGLHLPE
jgi:hypothetical protein